MKIRIISTPSHVCIDREHHADLFREIFVGMMFKVTIDPADSSVYLVELRAVLNALVEKRGIISIEETYWRMHWINNRLDDHVRFPRECCKVIDGRPTLSLAA